MADKHNREPIKHTCPDIDKVIDVINKIEKLCKLNGREDESDLKDIISDISNECWDLEKILNLLRKSNEELRSWAIDEAEYVDRLEEKFLNDNNL